MVSDSPTFLQTVLSHTSDFYQKLGLSINIGKTEFMQYTSDQASAALHIDDTHLNEVEHFKYLGSHISSDCNLDH